MTDRIDWKTTEDRADVVHRAVQALVEGGLVAFPTETVYGIAAYPLNVRAVDELMRLKQRDPGKPFSLAFGSTEKVLEIFPDLGKIERRLLGRCFPGPVTLLLATPQNQSAFSDFSPEVLQLVQSPQGTGVRIPAHHALLETLRLLPCPLLLTSANISGESPCVEAAPIAEQFGDELAMIIDDGRSPLEKPSSLVQVVDGRLNVLREGAVPEFRLRRLASEVILFVCTGNSCRSPMAEAIFKRMLADTLACSVDELPERGFTVMSAGIAAMGGGPATSGAMRAVEAFNASLADHTSQNLSAELVRHSDRIVVMTRDHREAIRAMAPELWRIAEPKTTLLGGENDIDDPIGGSLERYNACAQQISEYLRPLLVQVTREGSA